MARLWAGLDVGAETTTLCVINQAGEVLQEATCSSLARSIDREIRWLRRRRSAKLGLEAGNSGSAVARGLKGLGYTVDLYETRKLSRFLRARRNKTDAGDAAGIAEAGRIGASILSKVHLKNLECQELQSRLVIRRHLVRQRMAGMSLLCRQIELYGGRVPRTTPAARLRKVETEIARLFGRGESPLKSSLLYLVQHCQRLLERENQLERELAALARGNEVCRRFMEIPGVGQNCALTFYSAIGDPHRFKSSRDVGAYLGLTPSIHQSGLTSRAGRISKMGNKGARTALVQSSMSYMRYSKQDSTLRNWAARVAEHRGPGKARIALARKLAVIMLAIWKSGERFRTGPVAIAAVRRMGSDPG